MNSKHKLRKIISWLLTVLISANSIPLSVMADTLTTDKTDEPIPEEFTELGIDESVEEDFIEFEDSINKEELSEADDILSEDESIQTEIIEEQVDVVEIEQLSFGTPIEKPTELYSAELNEVLEVIELPELQTSAESISFFSDSWLKEGNYERWIDRLADLPEYAIDFYEWLEENSDNDGHDDALIEIEQASAVGDGYSYQIVSFNGELDVSFPSAQPTQDEINQAVNEAYKAQIGDSIVEAEQYILTTFSAFDRDRPEVFWLSGSSQVLSSKGFGGFYIQDDGSASVPYTTNVYFALSYGNFDIRADEYQDADAIKNDITERDALVAEITSTADGSRKEQLQSINNWLTTRNCYNSSSNLNNINHDARECLGALRGKAGTVGPVCEGYARAFKVLCDKLNIPCVLVDGQAKNSSTSSGEAHMWNYVQMDDENWYAVDVTWNDPVVSGSSAAVSGAENENWFLLGSDTVVSGMSFLTSHPVSNTVTQNGIAFTNGPVLAKTKYGEATNKIIASGTCGENLIWELSEDGVLTISGEGKMYDYQSLPDEIIVSVVIEPGVTSIGNYAFYDYDRLINITIPDSVTRIGDSAFSGCSKLTSIALPKNITEIHNSAFSGCSKLTNITLPEGITKISSGTFFDCESLTSITIPKNVNSIEGSAFSGCSKLTNITLPEGITKISDGTFYGCESLTSITIPNSVRKIGDSAFSGCSKLTTLTIPEDVTRISNGTFWGCESLSNITLPNAISEIDDYAFLGCDSLTSIAIPKSVTSIGSYAFDDCTALTDVYYGGTAEDWENVSIGESNSALTGATIHYAKDESLDLTVNVASSATLIPPADGWKEGSNTFTVSCDKACYVAVSYDGGETYTRLPAAASGNAYSFTADNVDTDTLIAVGIIGDVNGDGNITNADATRLRAIALGKVTLTNPTDVLGADVNNDGNLTNADATRLRAAALGKTTLSWS